MKKRIVLLVCMSLLIAVSAFGADGDLIVNGNLGVGTSSPGAKVDVNGDMNVSGNTTMNGKVTVGGTFAAPNVLTKYYVSPDQTITSAGSLTLAHGLGVEPVLIQVILRCTAAENGYNVDDKLFVNPNRTGLNHQGVVIVPDGSNLNIRFGSQPNVFATLNKSTGASVNLTNTKWKVVFRAWAF